MRAACLLLTSLLLVPFLVVPFLAQAAPAAEDGLPEATTLHFSVMRNGEPIGTSTIRLRRNGNETVADVTTRIEVKIAFLTVYRYQQSETERWVDGRLSSLTAHTDDNGTVHRINAISHGDKLMVTTDGKTSEVDPEIVPFSPWNTALLHKSMVLSTSDGTLTSLSVTDHGEEQLVLGGRALTAHHYSIRTSFPQDVWYDRQRRLVRVELSGSDGSKIRYQPG